MKSRRYGIILFSVDWSALLSEKYSSPQCFPLFVTLQPKYLLYVIRIYVTDQHKTVDNYKMEEKLHMVFKKPLQKSKKMCAFHLCRWKQCSQLKISIIK